MSSCAKPWPLSQRHQGRVARILLRFPDSEQAESLIEFGVNLARACGAHIRGLTLIDTSGMQELVTSCESAAYAIFEHRRLESGNERREEIRARFSQACLTAGLDFDLHRKRGALYDVLPGEARFHDLSITAVPRRAASANSQWGQNDLTAADAVELTLRGVDPMLVLRDSGEFPQRILLVQDGSQASSRAVRSFLAQGLFPEATVRLLAVGPTAGEAQHLLQEHADAARTRRPGVEVGCLAGRTPQIVPEYVRQWDADLVVLGAQRSPPVLRCLFGETARNILERTGSALYATH